MRRTVTEGACRGLVTLVDPTSAGLDVRVDLVVFPCAGGGPSMFARWPEHLPADWRLRGITLPGREQRFGEEYASDMRVLATQFAEVLQQAGSHGQRVYLGHSMGSVLALDVASRLEPDLLVTVATAPPLSGWTEHVLMSDERLSEELRGIVQDALSDQALDPCLVHELTTLAGEMLTADLALLETFAAPDRALTCDIDSYYGSEDHLACAPWRQETRGATSATVVAGDHFLVREPSRELVDDVVRRVVDRLDGRVACP